MVIHGGGPGLMVPRKRVELVDAMLLQEDNSISSWNNKATGASRAEEVQTSELSNSPVDKAFSPPLRSGDDLDCDSVEGLYAGTDDYGAYDQAGGYGHREAPSQLEFEASHEPIKARQDMEGAEEEVADSELPGIHIASMTYDDGVDMGFDELRDLIPALVSCY